MLAKPLAIRHGVGPSDVGNRQRQLLLIDRHIAPRCPAESLVIAHGYGVFAHGEVGHANAVNGFFIGLALLAAHIEDFGFDVYPVVRRHHAIPRGGGFLMCSGSRSSVDPQETGRCAYHHCSQYIPGNGRLGGFRCRWRNVPLLCRRGTGRRFLLPPRLGCAFYCGRAPCPLAASVILAGTGRSAVSSMPSLPLSSA